MTSRGDRNQLNTLRVGGNVDVTTINGIDFRELVALTVPIYTTHPVHIAGDTFVTVSLK